MQQLPIVLLVLSTLALTGCPSEFGRGGRIDRAVHKDGQEQLGIKSCSDAYKKEVCEGPQRDDQKCLECG